MNPKSVMEATEPAEAPGTRRELRILVFSDLHLDRAFPWAGVELAAMVRAGQQQTFETICAIAATEADVLISAGDLYDERTHHPDTGEVLRQAFEELAPMPVLLVPGNSDRVGKTSLYARVNWSPNVFVFESTGLTARPVADGLTIWGAAYPVDDINAAQEAVETGIHLAVYHGGPEQAPRGFRHTVNADDHRHHASENMTCPGVPIPLRPDDDTGSVTLINVLDDGEVATYRRELPNEPPRPRDAVFKTDALDLYDLATLGQEQTIRGELVRDLLAAEGPPELKRLALLLGLKALEGVGPDRATT